MADDDNVTIGPVRDADTGEIKTPASETGEGDGSNELGAENYDNDNIAAYDPGNDSSGDVDNFDSGGSGGGDLTDPQGFNDGDKSGKAGSSNQKTSKTEVKEAKENASKVADDLASTLNQGKVSPESAEKFFEQGKSNPALRKAIKRKQRKDVQELRNAVENRRSTGENKKATPKNADPLKDKSAREKKNNQESFQGSKVQVFNTNPRFGATENTAAPSSFNIDQPTLFQPDTKPFQEDAEGDKNDFFGLFPGGTNEELLETSVQIFGGAKKAGQAVTQGIENIQDASLSSVGITEKKVEKTLGIENRATNKLSNIQNVPLNSFSRVDTSSTLSNAFSLSEEGIQAATTGNIDKKQTVAAATPLITSEAEQDKSAELAGAAVKEAAEIPGLIVGAPGAFGQVAEDKDLTTAEAVAGGAGLSAKQVKENPSKFFTQEVGGEVLGVVSPGAAAIPDSVTVPETVDTPVRFAKGGGKEGLGFRAEETRSTPFRTDEAEVLRKTNEPAPGDQQGRVQIVEGRKFTEGGTELSTGTARRDITPVSRKQFLKEKLGLKDKSVAEAIDIGGTRKGQAGLPQSKEGKTGTDNIEDIGTDIKADSINDLFDEPETNPVNLDTSGKFSVPDATNFNNVELGQDKSLFKEQPTRNDQKQGLKKRNPPKKDQPFDQDLLQKNPPKEKQKQDPVLKVDTDQEKIEKKRLLESRGDPESKTSTIFNEAEDDKDKKPGEGLFTEKDKEYKASVGAEILGIKAQKKPGRLKAQNPTSLRPIIDEESNI